MTWKGRIAAAFFLAELCVACGPKCQDGKEASGKYCCWPGQAWSDEREACVGTPTCPKGTAARAGICLASAPKCPEGMVGIGATSFQLGSNRTGEEVRGSRPIHEMKLGPFCVDRTEVTVAAYKACVDAGTCSAPLAGEPGDPSWVDKACNQLLPDRMNHPVNCIDLKQATAYCRWAGKRLPSEEEWQLAAGRSDGRKFAWGDAPPGPDKANLRGGDGEVDRPLYQAKDGWKWTAPVGSFPADSSPFGLVDMGGNVSEWTSSVENELISMAGGSYDAMRGLRERAAVSRDSSGPMLGVRCAKDSGP